MNVLDLLKLMFNTHFPQRKVLIYSQIVKGTNWVLIEKDIITRMYRVLSQILEKVSSVT